MAMTGQTASLDAGNLIVTALQMGFIFDVASFSSSLSSSKCIDLWVRFDCENSVCPWIRSFTVDVISPACRNPG